MQTPRRGAFIVFEGVDRCGKTTQTRLLVEHLVRSGVPVQQMRFPDRTKVSGIMCDRYLRKALELADMDVHELFSLNRWECKDNIERLLASGMTLIVDRYAYSGVVYTSAKGYDLEACKRPDRGLPAPDRVIYLNVPVSDTQQRGNFGEEAGARYEKAAFQAKVAELYGRLADPSWAVIDGRGTIEQVHAAVVRQVTYTLAHATSQPLRKLWQEKPLEKQPILP